MHAAVTHPKCHKPNTQTFIIGSGGPSRGKYPLVRLQPIHGTFDRLTDARLRSPAESANALRIEKDEWNVADPPTLPAGVSEARRETQPGRNPAGRLPYLAIFVCPQIEDVDFSIGPVERRQYRIDAIGDVEIGFALQPVAEDVQAGRVLGKALHEIEDVTVRVALAEDGDGAKDIAAHRKAFGVRGDKTLAGELRSPVERSLDRERPVLRGWNYLALAVDRAGGGEGNRLDAVCTHRLQYVESRDGVLLQVPAWMVGAKPHVGVCRQMEYDLGAAHGLVEARPVEDISFDQVEARTFQCLGNELPPAGDEIVVTNDRVSALEQAVDEIAADESGGGGNKSAHISGTASSRDQVCSTSN